MKPHLPYTYSTLTDKIAPVVWEHLVETVENEAEELGLAEDIYYDVVRETVRQVQQELLKHKL